MTGLAPRTLRNCAPSAPSEASVRPLNFTVRRDLTMHKAQRFAWVAARVIFAAWYFGVGVLGFFTNNQAKDIANATTDLERVMAQTGFLNPLLCLCCSVGGAALFLRPSAPLGLVVLAPLVIIIFCFHIFITKDYWWGALNLGLLIALSWHFREGLKPLWNYSRSES